MQFFCQIFATFTLLCHTRVIYISIQYLLTYLVLTYLHLICYICHFFFLTQKILSKSAYLLIGQPFFVPIFEWHTSLWFFSLKGVLLIFVEYQRRGFWFCRMIQPSESEDLFKNFNLTQVYTKLCTKSKELWLFYLICFWVQFWPWNFQIRS